MKYGILVGRLQPLHAGHQHLIDTIIADDREPIITLGNYTLDEIRSRTRC